jgi:NADH:ubiquinone oxidoreductase subunit 5 (subunit L)/multisubunit Na+/H+ antiporter MnhA subunit
MLLAGSFDANWVVGTPYANYFEEFIFPPSETLAEVAEKAAEFNQTEFFVMAGSSVGISLIGITLASLMYLQGKINPAAIAAKIKPLYELSLNKWYFDDIYDLAFVKGLRRLARQVMEVDFRVVDGAVNLTGFFTLISGEGTEISRKRSRPILRPDHIWGSFRVSDSLWCDLKKGSGVRGQGLGAKG